MNADNRDPCFRSAFVGVHRRLIFFHARAQLTTTTRCGTLATIPRMAALSGRSTTWSIFRKPSPRTTTLCFSGAQIGLRTSLILIVPAISELLHREAADIGHGVLVAQLLERRH